MLTAARARPLLTSVSSTLGRAIVARGLSYAVRRGDILTPAAPIHPRQLVERTWTLSSSIYRPRYNPRYEGRYRHHHPPASSALEKLKLSTPGVTLIRVQPELEPDVVAQIKVSSNARELLECVDINVGGRCSRQGAEVAFDPERAAISSSIYGNLLTEISVPNASALRQIAARGCGDVVISDHVVANGEDKLTAANSLRIAAVRSSRVFLVSPTTPLYVRKIACGVAGNGAIYLKVPSITTTSGDINLGVLGNGLVLLDADEVTAHEISMGVVGNGSVWLRAASRLRTPEMNAGILGSGRVTVDTPRAEDVVCNDQSLGIIGSGAIDVGACPTHEARVFNIGRSETLLRVRDYLRARAMGRSYIECVGGLPDHINARGMPKPWIKSIGTDEWRTQHDEFGFKGMPKDMPTAEAAFAEDYVLQMPYGYKYCAQMQSMRKILHMKCSRRDRRREDRDQDRGDRYERRYDNREERCGRRYDERRYRHEKRYGYEYHQDNKKQDPEPSKENEKPKDSTAKTE